MRVRALVSVSLGVAVLSAGTVGEFAGASHPAKAPAHVVTIGVVAPLVAGVTQYGRGIRNSVQLAVNQANAQRVLGDWKIKIRAVDDSSTPSVGAANVAAIINDPSVIGVVGTYNSGVAAQVAPLLQAAGIAMISPGNTNPTLTLGPDEANPVRQFSNYFRMVANDSAQGGFLAQFALSDVHATTAAVVSVNQAVSVGLSAHFMADFEAGGGTITSHQVVPLDTTDFTAYATLAAAGNPDVLFFGGEYLQAAALKQAAVAAGITGPLMGGDGIQANEYITIVGADAQGDLASSVGAPIAANPNGAGFIAAYTAAGFGDEASSFGPDAYDAAAILLNAVKGALRHRSRVDAAVRSAVIRAVGATTTAPVGVLEQRMNRRNRAWVSGSPVTGDLGFDAFGDTIAKVLTMYTVNSGAWEVLVTRRFT